MCRKNIGISNKTDRFVASYLKEANEEEEESLMEIEDDVDAYLRASYLIEQNSSPKVEELPDRYL